MWVISQPLNLLRTTVSHWLDRSVRLRATGLTFARSIKQSFSLENLGRKFFDSGVPGFGLFGCRKVEQVSSLPPWREGPKGPFKGKVFVESILKFFGNFEL